MKSALTALAALALLTFPAAAAQTAIQVVISLDGNAERNVVTYQCEGVETQMVVDYINAAPNFLAFVPIDGVNMVFSNVTSASGAKYVAGKYEWWTKGPDATLTDVTAEEGTEPLACFETDLTP